MPQSEIFCGNCRTPNPYGMQYCRKCGALLAYTQPVQFPPAGQQPYAQQPYAQQQPYQQPYAPPPPSEPASNWIRWVIWVTVAMIAAMLCAGLGLAVYVVDPFGFMPTPTILPTKIAAALPPTATVQPTLAATPLPTFTPYPTYTSYPTLEPIIIPTLALPTKAVEMPTPAASPTLAAEAFKFSEGGVSSPQVKYGGCGPAAVDFSVKVSSRQNVLGIILFTRLMDPVSNAFITEWTSGVAMPYEGDNRYKITQSGNALRQGKSPASAIVVYQFVNQTKKGDYIRSQRYQNLTLSACP
jgi:hypothetical protein